MTSGRFAPVGAALVSAVLTITTPGCGNDANRCTDCPAIEGRYRMEFGDAGTPGECTQLGVALPDGQPLNIARTEDRLTGTAAGLSLQGSISTQGAFSLSGSSASTDGGVSGTLSLAGSYTPPVGDGGTARLAGSFVGGFSRQGGPQRCSLNSPFSATRE